MRLIAMHDRLLARLAALATLIFAPSGRRGYTATATKLGSDGWKR
jgi:hypothetical protein